MKYIFRRIFSLCLLLLLFTACSSPIGGFNAAVPTPTPTATPTPTPSPTPTPTPSATSSPIPAPITYFRSAPVETCPGELKTVPGCFTPKGMRAAYNVKALLDKGFTGKGQTIVDIVSFGSPTLQQDMDVFDAQFGLPAITIQVVTPLGTKPFDPQNREMTGWAEETELDVQIIHAIAPDAGIVVLSSPVSETEGTAGLPEFRQLEKYAVDNKLGTIISQSWGASEVSLQDQAGQQEIQQWTSFFQQATMQQHITFFTGSGDNGATDYVNTTNKLSPTPTTSFPSDEPWVTSVGGTTLMRDTLSLDEMAWDGSGGGFSRFFQTPSFQQGLPASVTSMLQGRRGVPDVAGDSNPSTAMAIYVNTHWQAIGGTSASAPFWAALTAIANQMAGHPLGFINPGLYKLATSGTYIQDFYDITVGNNSNDTANVQGYDATVGWDPITGLGSPNAALLIPDLIAALK